MLLFSFFLRRAAFLKYFFCERCFFSREEKERKSTPLPWNTQTGSDSTEATVGGAGNRTKRFRPEGILGTQRDNRGPGIPTFSLTVITPLTCCRSAGKKSCPRPRRGCKMQEREHTCASSALTIYRTYIHMRERHTPLSFSPAKATCTREPLICARKGKAVGASLRTRLRLSVQPNYSIYLIRLPARCNMRRNASTSLPASRCRRSPDELRSTRVSTNSHTVSLPQRDLGSLT